MHLHRHEIQRYEIQLYEIQKSIDYLNLKSFSNLPQWVSKLDDEVEKKLANRLTTAINSWIDVLVKKNAAEDMNNTTGN